MEKLIVMMAQTNRFRSAVSVYCLQSCYTLTITHSNKTGTSLHNVIKQTNYYSFVLVLFHMQFLNDFLSTSSLYCFVQQLTDKCVLVFILICITYMHLYLYNVNHFVEQFIQFIQFIQSNPIYPMFLNQAVVQIYN